MRPTTTRIKPKHANIFPAADNLMGLKITQSALLNFTMALQNPGHEYNQSVFWGRDSAVAGVELKGKYYKLLQVVDENGNKLEPAWTEYAQHCESDESGTTKGSIWYREATPPPQIVASVKFLPTGETDQSFWAKLKRTFDTRFDTYTRAVVMSINGQKWVRPTPINVTVPTSKEDVPLIDLPNVAGVEVPKTDEHWPDVSDMAAMAQKALAYLPFPDSADECGTYAKGENPRTLIRTMIQKYPDNRVLVPWGVDKMSDSALEELVFYGVGQHRIEKIRPGDTWAPQVPGGAYYAIYLNFAATLAVKPGFAKMGADAYFDSKGTILGIVRNGKLWKPTDPLGQETTCTGMLWWKSCSYSLGWRHAKMAFRGTLMAMVTFIDHLYGLHFTIGNAIVTSNVRELSPNHKLRRLLTPFGFRTEAINYQAAMVLSPEYHLVHRAGSLSNKGLFDAFAYANTSSRMISWSVVSHKIKNKGDTVDTFPLPIDEDGTDYYKIINKYVKSYLSLHYDYASNACGADNEIHGWYMRSNAILPQYDLPMPLTCENLEEVVSMFMYLVSAMHQHVGTIGAEVDDPCFAPWAWREGELCSPPRAFFTQAAIMLSTAFEQPRIMEDYSHMFEDAPSKALWKTLTADLANFKTVVDARNSRTAVPLRKRPYLGFDPSTIETGISI